MGFATARALMAAPPEEWRGRFELLDEAGTLYLVAPAEDAERCRPLFSALVMSLLRRATAGIGSLTGASGL